MATVPLPERPSLEQLRKQAREVQRGVRAGDPDALALTSVDRVDPGFTLHAAQLALARHHGFASWDRMRRHVVELEARTWLPPAGEPSSPAELFVRRTCVDYAGGGNVFDSRIAADSSTLAAAAVAADLDALQLRLAGASDVDEPCGPFGWSPLMYLAFSRHDAGEVATLAAARLLLAGGADPNEGRYFAGLPSPFTLLTGVLGGGEHDQPPHPHSLALARLLLSAGADPNDAQTLYNRQFDASDDRWLALLFDFGLGTGDGGPWRRRLPDLADSPTRMVRRLLRWAVEHDQRDRVALLAGRGVDVRSPFGRSGRTPLAVARRNGHRELAELLRDLGAAEDSLTSPVDAFLGAVLAGDVAAARAADPTTVAAARQARPGLVVWAAAQGRPAAVELAVSLDFTIDALSRGDAPIEQPWQTALHTAVEHDDAATVATLLRLGARTDIRDARFDATARDWAQFFERPHLAALLDGQA